MDCNEPKGFLRKLCFKEKHHCCSFCILLSPDGNLNPLVSPLNTTVIEEIFILIFCSSRSFSVEQHVWHLTNWSFSPVKITRKERGCDSSHPITSKSFLYWNSFGTSQPLGHSFSQHGTKLMCF